MSINTDKVQKDIQILINEIREDPTSFIPTLEAHLKCFKGKHYKIPGTHVNVVTQEGPDAVIDSIKFLKKSAPVSILKASHGLHLAAKDHALDIGSTGRTSHEGGDGSRMSERIDRYGNWDHSIAENITFDDTQASDIVLGMIVDDGNQNRGHRKNILNPDFKYFGVAIAAHKKHKFVTVIDFAVHYEENADLIEDKVKEETYAKKTIPFDDLENSNFEKQGNKDESKVFQTNAIEEQTEMKSKRSQGQQAVKVSSGMKTSSPKLVENEVKESAKNGSNSNLNNNLSSDRVDIKKENDVIPKSNQQHGENMTPSSSHNDASKKISENNSKTQNYDQLRSTFGSGFNQKLIIEEYDIDNDSEWPEGAVNVKVRRHIKIINNSRIVKMTKTYDMGNGEQEIIESTENETF